MIDKMNKAVAPSKDGLIDYVGGSANSALKDICTHVETAYSAKPQIDYSICSMAPGWNLKYKKSGKAVFTVYPERDMFSVLVTLNNAALEFFDAVSQNFSPYIRDLVKNASGSGQARWFWIEVKETQTAEDVKKLLGLKFGGKIN